MLAEEKLIFAAEVEGRVGGEAQQQRRRLSTQARGGGGYAARHGG